LPDCRIRLTVACSVLARAMGKQGATAGKKKAPDWLVLFLWCVVAPLFLL
jgi:hypothetical protein